MIFLGYNMNNLLKFCNKLVSLSVINGKYSLFRTPLHRKYCQQNIDVNTNVVKDVILYKSNYERFYKMLNLFGLAQFGFWTYLSLTSVRGLFRKGWGCLAVTWVYTMKSVKYLILRKGGNQATIVTYGPFGKNKMFTLDLANMSAKEARTAGRPFIPIKVKGHYFHYMVDMRGEFRNPRLFDHTAGLRRVWKD